MQARVRALPGDCRNLPSRNPILLEAFTFEGKPFGVSIPSLKTAGRGIFVGHIVDSDPPQLVAVKVLGNTLEDHEQELLLRELQAARQVSIGGHPSILPCMGTASLPCMGTASFGFHTAILSQYMKNGNLLEYFKAHRGRESIDKKRLIIQVAEAVNHLHTVERLVHGDIKCENVLVSDTGDALLADFGLSTFVEKAQTSSTTTMNIRQMYTMRFAAPEILRDVAGYPARVRSKTRESDVYAFGMLVLEAMTEQPPWAGASGISVMVWVCSGYHPVRPDAGFSQLWWDVCRRCWSPKPARRPTMQSVLITLAAAPIDLSLSTPLTTCTSTSGQLPSPGASPQTLIPHDLFHGRLFSIPAGSPSALASPPQLARSDSPWNMGPPSPDRTWELPSPPSTGRIDPLLSPPGSTPLSPEDNPQKLNSKWTPRPARGEPSLPENNSLELYASPPPTPPCEPALTLGECSDCSYRAANPASVPASPVSPASGTRFRSSEQEHGKTRPWGLRSISPLRI